MSRFENPYNFISLPERPQDGSLADAGAEGSGGLASHARYHPDRWSGRITVSMTTLTPLLIPEKTREEQVGEGNARHTIHDIRRDADGKPLIPPTSVKGMLRSAYEALTNSRFGAFEDHDKRLGMRPDPGEALRMVPAIVEGKTIRLLRGTTNHWPFWDGSNARWSLPTRREAQRHSKPPREVSQPQYAAWLLRYPNESGLTFAGTNHLPPHGAKVGVRLREIRSGFLHYWEVFEIVPWKTAQEDWSIGKSKQSARQADSMLEVKGWVVVTNHNIDGKRYERVFFEEPTMVQPKKFPLTPHLRDEWNSLMDHVADLHRDKFGPQRPNPEDFISPEQPGISRHVIEGVAGGDRIAENGVPANTPLLCYARIARDENNQAQVLGLYPVMIPRLLQEKTPAELLSESHRPAQALSELSPADRVFGWAGQKGAGAWRGQLRVGAVSTDAKPKEAIQPFCPDGLPLAILGQPKPGQWRFYSADAPQGSRLPDGQHPRLSPKAHTDEGRIGLRMGLRGRKVYPHHTVLEVGEKALHPNFAEGYWDPDKAKTDLKAGRVGRGLCREYRRPVPSDAKPEDGNRAARDTQNRTIQAWIKPEVTFTFDLHITNLSAEELGALLWLLDERAREPERDESDGTPCRAIHRLGLGKPLGFGSVEVAITGLDLRDGDAIRADYTAFGEATTATTHGDRLTDPRDIAESVPLLNWREAAAGSLDAPLDAPHHRALIAAARGIGRDHPVHYPRTETSPQFKTENFKWFVENEKGGGHAKPHTLPALGEDSDLSLPLKPREGG